ncbi:MAG TPA: hypothetical protein VGX76_07265, partial [Pirellulales bacterium]|nr:hypothetical protein [Pirellulales bacterium]
EAGQVDEAVASYECSLALWERLVREYPDNANFRDNLARLDYNFGELLLERDAARARGRFEQAVEIFAAFLDPHGLDGEVPINFALSLNGKAQAEIALERFAEARQSLERARERLESLFAEHASRVYVQQGLAANHNLFGELDLRSGNAEEALSEFHRAGGLLEPLVAADPRAHRYRSQWATILRNTSQAQRKLHRIDEADASLRRAIDAIEAIVEQAPEVADYRELLASFRAELDCE